MKSFPRSLALVTLLLGLAALPVPSTFAADASPSPSASPSASPAAKKLRTFPFHGKVTAVDLSAMTFTLNGTPPRVFTVTATTKIRKNGKTATLKDAVVGDDVGGYTERGADGTLTALSVRFGPRPKAGASPAPSPAAASASATPKAKHLKKPKPSPSPSAS